MKPSRPAIFMAMSSGQLLLVAFLCGCGRAPMTSEAPVMESEPYANERPLAKEPLEIRAPVVPSSSAMKTVHAPAKSRLPKPNHEPAMPLDPSANPANFPKPAISLESPSPNAMKEFPLNRGPAKLKDLESGLIAPPQ